MFREQPPGLSWEVYKRKNWIREKRKLMKGCWRYFVASKEKLNY